MKGTATFPMPTCLMLTARQMFDHYLTTHANGIIEDNLLIAARGHLNHFTETLGERFRIQGLTLLDMQAHIDRRRKRGIVPVRLKKEVARLLELCLAGGAPKGTGARGSTTNLRAGRSWSWVAARARTVDEGSVRRGKAPERLSDLKAF